MSFRFKAVCDSSASASGEELKKQVVNLGDGSEVVHISRFLPLAESWKWFDYLDKEIPWIRPTIRVYGRSCVQPRDMCYVSSPELMELSYSGYQPHTHSWDDFPRLRELLDAARISEFSIFYVVTTMKNLIAFVVLFFVKVRKALPGSRFNSVLLNRYKGGGDYVSWHADDEKLYGLTPEIASLSFGCEREFLLRKKKPKAALQGQGKTAAEEPLSKRLKSNTIDQHSFNLKHGSLLVMRGYTQRDWLHSVPKRAKATETRINLTFRLIMQ
uniref:Fe2OG dioxygenase domain-containing protein n=1 Tax=Kalanchoe fedtschenkoi TaxID=63787 RepID=A0A7N0UW45_KALFE